MTATLQKPKALLFDWDNTLVDTWSIIHDALNVTLEAFQMTPWTMEETRARVARSMRDSFPGLFGDNWERAAEIFYGRFEDIHLKNLNPLTGVADVLPRLKGEGYYLAIVSNKRGHILRTEIEHLGWGALFGRVVGADDAARDKPAPDPILLALEGSGVPASGRVWYAGDTAVDMETARAAGCVGVLVRGQPPEDGEFPDHPPALHVADCKALFKALSSL